MPPGKGELAMTREVPDTSPERLAAIQAWHASLAGGVTPMPYLAQAVGDLLAMIADRDSQIAALMQSSSPDDLLI
jgi:hypothetical protein